MNKIKKMLPALAMVLGATFAMAMNAPAILDSNPPEEVFTPDSSEPSNYRNVTEEYNNLSYNCDNQEMECLVQFSNDDPATGIKSILDEGQFTVIP
ncbi:DUF6520 family protein [Algoriphagus aquimarinus]|uniref:Uncharacterized protein n=1 Tax=Algoriphagus aquimarinus TaxID=237018 RepID=A0A5C7A8Y0_9BACT|nr:DUF6520 family protein [Algoriphagus aquimarinus]TXE03067.1 hypothetical protein ESV85_20605 [Algoriphagus aquimarinus]